MLRVLRIRNLALIRDLEIEFDRGLNLLTGETGSGKSILVDALGLLLGARSSQEIIRSDCDAAMLEGLFEIEAKGSVSRSLADAGFEGEDDTLLIRREIASSGRNRIFINNHLATLSLLKSLGDKLADIHGQQDQRSLLDLSTHREWLDYFGNNGALLKEVQEAFGKLSATARQIESMASSEQERLRRMDVLQYQIEEIRGINPGPDEKEELENERNILTNREKILALATEAFGILYEGEVSILRQINRVEKILEELSPFDKNWGMQQEALQDSKYKLQDIAYMARDYAAGSDFSPERLEQVHQRLYALEKLTKKYGASCGEILQFLDSCQSELDQILAYADRSENLSRQFESELDAYRRSAQKLSEKRRKDAAKFQDEIEEEFKALAMERMQIHVQFGAYSENKGTGVLPASYGLHGIDRVEFLLAPNKGEEIRPLAKIASGGELSRLMLGIKSLCRNEEADKTFVFDEVDAGIGGRVAEAVGRRLRSIAEDNQVLCVTHLPQIAAFARCHFSVRKVEIGGRTETIVKSLSASERIQELSRMLGGETITQTARDHAQEMLEYAMGERKKR
ncbi:MAG TPA: DNA repair protein RecN [Acidobacteriota bacterium]|nr:DNA repair protein RecN [Acidobacteriota bacterium]